MSAEFHHLDWTQLQVLFSLWFLKVCAFVIEVFKGVLVFCFADLFWRWNVRVILFYFPRKALDVLDVLFVFSWHTGSSEEYLFLRHCKGSWLRHDFFSLVEVINHVFKFLLNSLDFCSSSLFHPIFFILLFSTNDSILKIFVVFCIESPSLLKLPSHYFW